MIRKGQMHGVVKGDITGQVTFLARLSMWWLDGGRLIPFHDAQIAPLLLSRLSPQSPLQASGVTFTSRQSSLHSVRELCSFAAIESSH
jgi:hypothetical protein